MHMKLKDIQKDKKEDLGQIVSARVPLEYKTYIVNKKIDMRKFVMKAIDELKEQEGAK
jgi:hypothetical protein